MPRIIFLLTALALLVGVNFTIYQREQLITTGRIVLLELAPVDPRSLMQGDYMALRFKLVADAFPANQSRDLKDGELVLAVAPDGVASFRRFHDTTPLAGDEALLRYRIRNQQPKLASNAFFFEEGHARDYDKARYGAFRVAPDGDAILVALHGEDRRPLGVPNIVGASASAQ